MTAYPEDEMLMLSGIQHFGFCRRQWALIHVFRQWEENSLTVEGRHLHRNADDSFARDFRDGVFRMRGVGVRSERLGLYGVCDVVELLPLSKGDGGSAFPGADGFWDAYPVEYKRGASKVSDCDLLQICAQAICLEESNSIRIARGYLYYGRSRRRMEVEFDASLRRKTFDFAAQMHDAFAKRECFRAEYSGKCASCSLFEICGPKCETRRGGVSAYLEQLRDGR